MTTQGIALRFKRETKIYYLNMLATPEAVGLVVNQGGGSSSKTYSVLQKYAFVLPLQYPGARISVVGASFPSIERGVLEDFNRILGENEIFRLFIFRILKGTHPKAYFCNGSLVEFFSVDTPGNAKYGKRDFLFVNEANNVPYSVFSELYQRTRRQTTIDFNPSGLFWYNEEIEGKRKAQGSQADGRKIVKIRSTFLDNPFISEGERERILSYREADPYLWEVYGMGNYAQRPDRIYQFTEVDSLPAVFDFQIFGLDFGYSADPTALVEIRIQEKARRIYAHEHIYRTHLTESELVALIREALGTALDKVLIFADSANPMLINGLQMAGLPVFPCVKGAHSVINGIQAVKEYAVYYTRKSQNLKREADNYSYRKDPAGKLTAVPVDAFNHALDALRYAVFSWKARKK